MTDDILLPLNLPVDATRRERAGYRRLCQVLCDLDARGLRDADRDDWLAAADITDLYDQPRLAAAAHAVIDMTHQGWTITVDRLGPLFAPPDVHVDLQHEKARIRAQELIRRNAQLSQPSVRRFVLGMEKLRVHNSRALSIFDLMRDGGDLAQALADLPDTRTDSRGAIEPYVQIADDSRCDLTGFRLLDIWRYFRHTWSNAWASVPGRTMPLLIRDAAVECHPVIGLAALASPVVQIAERDTWIGWDSDTLLADFTAAPTMRDARWVARRIKSQLRDLHSADLVSDGVISAEDLSAPTREAVARLRADAERHRRRHHRYGHIRQVRRIRTDAWVERAETDLFRSKRSATLAEAFEIAMTLEPYLSPTATIAGLRRLLDDRDAVHQLRRLVRRARGERVGTVIADLSVCGAIPPYNHLAAGKLVAALAISPTVLEAYRMKYDHPSEIASAMAGRAIIRESRLAFIGTTSLYGTGSSQYNRLYWPAEVVGGEPETRMGFYSIGRSRSFGTSHFSNVTVDALVRLSTLGESDVRVNSLFGEGVSPRLRKVRIGLAALGWPANELLKHGRFRLVYGAPLVRNLRDFSLGVTTKPEYLFDVALPDDHAAIAAWWYVRWARQRATRSEVVAAMSRNTLVRPIAHGARVPLPEDGDNEADDSRGQVRGS